MRVAAATMNISPELTVLALAAAPEGPPRGDAKKPESSGVSIGSHRKTREPSNTFNTGGA